MVDSETTDGHRILGTWRDEIRSNGNRIGTQGSNNHKKTAGIIRNNFNDYFNQEGQVEWQLDRVLEF